jgi:hypothetical protein
MTWEKVFSFSVDSKGQLELTLNEKPIYKDDRKDALPAGDAGITYYHGAQTTSNPSYFVQQELPSEHLDEILKSLQSVFHNKWVNITLVFALCCSPFSVLISRLYRHFSLLEMMCFRSNMRHLTMRAICSLMHITIRIDFHISCRAVCVLICIKE